ncbi:YmfQ family protein [Caproiciproducens galactitolivorans]|uniref:Phage portal protein n=1 Tax=Caproiciproducens galactitolivorans TaxID=642589 RepID=A0A4Z0XVI3_9FIRM|nr:YmfQ family protein [Caproiciproducens galactitolivorans]TGJ75429.1 hypothetical protein CAGA_24540 [Caproiciproducens galactitolivorans]
MALIDLLPPNYKGSEPDVQIQAALNAQVQKLMDAKDDLLLQLNVQTATWGLDLWEKVLGLATDVSKPFSFRRSRIESKLRSQGVTTKLMIQNVAESFSNGIVEIIEHPALYSFDVKFIGTLGIPPNMDDLIAAIEEIKPAHLAYSFIYTFITWDKVEAYSHTWDEWDALGLTWDAFETYKEDT